MVGLLTITAAAQFRNYTGFPVKISTFPSPMNIGGSGTTHQIVNEVNVRLFEKRVKDQGSSHLSGALRSPNRRTPVFKK